MVQKDCKRKEGSSQSRELLRLRLLDDSEVDCTVSVWGETAKALSQKPLQGSAIAMYRLKLKVDGNSKELTTAEDSYILLLDSADGVSQREDKIINGKETILGAGAKSCATMYEGGADVSGELRVICLRSLALAAELKIQLQERCDAHVVCSCVALGYLKCWLSLSAGIGLAGGGLHLGAGRPRECRGVARKIVGKGHVARCFGRASSLRQRRGFAEYDRGG